MPKLAQRMSRAKPSAIMLIAEKARQLKAEGRDIISFSIGVPNFLPGPHVYQAVRDWLEHDSGSYGSNRGSKPLIDAFLHSLEGLGLDGYGAENCVVKSGAKQVLYDLGEVLLDEGDEIAFPTPYWTSYVDVAEILGARIKLLPCPPEQNYKLVPEQLDEALASKPKIFQFNNPSNPTGMVYTRDEIAALADVLVKHPDTWIVNDDIYSRMIFDGVGYHNFVQARPELRDRAIFVDSLSKTYGMPGWRVGLMAGPKVIADAMATLNSNHITSIPEVAAVAGTAALNGPQDVPEEKCAEFARRRDIVVDILNGIPGVTCPRPQGAFYAFPDISCAFGKRHGDTLLENDVDVCNALMDAKGVVCVPGSAFGEPRGLRISYSCKPEELEPGMNRIREFFAELS